MFVNKVKRYGIKESAKSGTGERVAVLEKSSVTRGGKKKKRVSSDGYMKH